LVLTGQNGFIAGQFNSAHTQLLSQLFFLEFCFFVTIRLNIAFTDNKCAFVVRCDIGAEDTRPEFADAIQHRAGTGYAQSLQCAWMVQTMPGESVRLHFTFLNTEPKYEFPQLLIRFYIREQ
jgi:hypothetical protein